MRDRNRHVEYFTSEFFPDALLEHRGRICIEYAILDHVAQNPRHYGVIVATISRQDDRDVRRPRKVGRTSSLTDLLVVMLRRECQRVIDAVRVPGNRHEQNTRLYA